MWLPKETTGLQRRPIALKKKQTLSEISETLREMTEKGEVMNEGIFMEVSKKLMKIHQSM